MRTHITVPFFCRFRLNWTFVFSCISVLVPILLPWLQFDVFYRRWKSYDVRVSRDTCSCNCWDTIFKGPYEGPASGYKHIYFNVNRSTLLVWAITVLSVVIVYEVVKRLLTLLACGRLRFSMALLVMSSLYPHYYFWWSLFNAFNDDYFDQFNHQAVFSTTEVVSTALVLGQVNTDQKPSARSMLAVLVIASAHVFAAGRDQFVDNVLYGSGADHQRARDVGFMLVDVLHLIIPYLTLRSLKSSAKWRDLLSFDELSLALVSVVLLWLVIMVT